MSKNQSDASQNQYDVNVVSPFSLEKIGIKHAGLKAVAEAILSGDEKGLIKLMEEHKLSILSRDEESENCESVVTMLARHGIPIDHVAVDIMLRLESVEAIRYLALGYALGGHDEMAITCLQGIETKDKVVHRAGFDIVALGATMGRHYKLAEYCLKNGPEGTVNQIVRGFARCGFDVDPKYFEDYNASIEQLLMGLFDYGGDSIVVAEKLVISGLKLPNKEQPLPVSVSQLVYAAHFSTNISANKLASDYLFEGVTYDGATKHAGVDEIFALGRRLREHGFISMLIESQEMIHDGYAIKKITFTEFYNHCRANNSTAYRDEKIYRPFLEETYNEGFPVSKSIYDSYRSEDRADVKSLAEDLSYSIEYDKARIYARMKELFMIAVDFTDNGFIVYLITSGAYFETGKKDNPQLELVTFGKFDEFYKAHYPEAYQNGAKEYQEFWGGFFGEMHRSRLQRKVAVSEGTSTTIRPRQYALSSRATMGEITVDIGARASFASKIIAQNDDSKSQSLG